MFLIGMLWHWLMNMLLWVILIILGCWLLQRTLKKTRGGHSSTAEIGALGIFGYVLGSVIGWLQGWITVPESIKDMADPEPYFRFIHCHTMNGAHILALLGLIVGLVLFLKRGRQSA